MSHDGPQMPEGPAPIADSDSHAVRIRDARAQVEAARLRQRMGAPVPGELPGRPPPGYTLVRELHRGGQGIVYLAVQQSTERRVAIKILNRAPSHGAADAAARFEREVEALSLLKHPNIVTIHDCGRDQDHVYLVMDYVDGRPLDVYVQAGRLPVPDTLRLFARICDGVGAAHLRGIIHRDLKPGNILVDARGEPHVLDFGLAKLADAAPDASKVHAMTVTGQFVGSLPWASPEQAEGRTDDLDIRTDVYSLGVVLYQVLTGKFPYPVSGGLSDVVRHIVHTNPVRPSTLDRRIDHELETILLKCLAKERHRRYASVAELGADIRRLLAGEPVAAKRDSSWYLVRKAVWRHRAAFAVAAVILLLLVASSVVGWTLYGRAQRAHARSTELLHQSYITQARATRERGGAGRRFDALDALGKAAAIRVAPELRDEAIACLALADLEVERELPWVRVASARGLARIDRVAVAGTGVVRVLGVDDGRELCALRSPDVEVGWMRFSPSGAYLAGVFRGEDGADGLLVWSIPGAEPVFRAVKPEYSGRFTLGGSPGHEWLARLEAGDGEPSSRVVINELPSLREIARFPVQAGAWTLGPDADGTRLAVTGPAGTSLDVYEVPGGRQLLSIPATGELRHAAWSADGRVIAAGGDFDIHCWDAATGEPLRTMTGHRATVTEVWFGAGDGSRGPLVSFGWDGTSRLWDAATGEPLLAPIIGATCIGADGRRIVLAGERSLRVMRWRADTPVRTFVAAGPLGPLSTADFAPDGRRLAVAGTCGVQAWDLESGTSVTLTDRPARCLFFAPAVGILAALVGNELVAWDAPAGGAFGQARVVWRGGARAWACLYPDGRGALMADGHLKVVDLASGEEARLADGFAGMERPSATSDGRWLFAGTWHGEPARIIDTVSGRSVLSFDRVSVRGSISADGRFLAVGLPGLFRVFRVGDWRDPRTIECSGGETNLGGASAFSRDGALLAASVPPHEVRLLDPATGATLATLANPERYGPTDLRFSPDGRRLVITTLERQFMLWDVAELRRSLSELGLDW